MNRKVIGMPIFICTRVCVCSELYACVVVNCGILTATVHTAPSVFISKIRDPVPKVQGGLKWGDSIKRQRGGQIWIALEFHWQ